jgi:hypothetical protein
VALIIKRGFERMKELSIEQILDKESKYKRAGAKRNFQRKHFGIADGDVITLNGMVRLIVRIMRKIK